MAIIPPSGDTADTPGAYDELDTDSLTTSKVAGSEPKDSTRAQDKAASKQSKAERRKALKKAKRRRDTIAASVMIIAIACGGVMLYAYSKTHKDLTNQTTSTKAIREEARNQGLAHITTSSAEQAAQYGQIAAKTAGVVWAPGTLEAVKKMGTNKGGGAYLIGDARDIPDGTCVLEDAGRSGNIVWVCVYADGSLARAKGATLTR